MVAHLLLRVQKENPLEHRRIITYLTTIIPSTDADKKEWTDEKYENVKATKYIIYVCTCNLHFLKESLKSYVFKSNSGLYFLNCIQEFIQINTLLIKMSRYYVSSLIQTLSPSSYKTVVVSISHLSST